MGFSAKSALTLALIATSVALISVSYFNQLETTTSDGDNLECGFTQDFQSFLSSSGTSSC
jgi:hypothetical protein